MADYLFNALVTLFVTIDPIGLAPLFVVLTAGRTGIERRTIGIRAVIIAGVALAGFALVGEPFIGFLGVSLPALRISGGLLLFVIAFEMVFGRRGERKSATAETAAAGDDLRHVAVFPLAIPLIAGPGAISATILIASQSDGPAGIAGLLAIIAILLVACLGVFLAAERIEKMLGETGVIVVTRLLGLILAALAVQYVADGILAFARTA